MPTSIPPFDTDRRTYRRWVAGVAVFYAVLAGGLLGLASSQPKVAAWVSKGAQAEFASSAPAAAPETVRVAAKRLGTR